MSYGDLVDVAVASGGQDMAPGHYGDHCQQKQRSNGNNQSLPPNFIFLLFPHFISPFIDFILFSRAKTAQPLIVWHSEVGGDTRPEVRTSG